MFHSLDDYKKKETNEDKDKKKNTESYTGGKSSGMAVENPLDKKEEFDKQKDKVNLKVYKNGFILEDGPFRSLTDADNQKFMTEIEKGYIPNELVKKGYKELGIAIEDHKKDDYVEPIPEKKFEAFVGSGQSIGNVDMKGLAVNKNVKSTIDNSKPVCKINIRLFNGTTVNETFNTSNTLRDICAFVEKASGSKSFQLLDGFPPKPLTQMNKTIEELKIQGSTLTQKIS